MVEGDKNRSGDGPGTEEKGIGDRGGGLAGRFFACELGEEDQVKAQEDEGGEVERELGEEVGRFFHKYLELFRP